MVSAEIPHTATGGHHPSEAACLAVQPVLPVPSLPTIKVEHLVFSLLVRSDSHTDTVNDQR